MNILNTETNAYRSDDQVRVEYGAANFSPPFFPYPPDVRVQTAPQPAVDSLTHEVVEAQPAQVDGIWTQAWTVQALPVEVAAQRLNAARNALLSLIDAEADAIRSAVLGSRTTEYQEAYADALAFKTAGYSGTMPPGVRSWFDAKAAVGAGWTAQQCADDIIATGGAWKTAQEAIRAQRLLRKEQARGASASDLAAIGSAWAAFVGYIKGQLGLTTP